MQAELSSITPHKSEHPSSGEEAKRKYAKLTPELKDNFLKRIVFDNMTIKQASELLNINYSSAKAILSAHKKSKTSVPRKMTSKLAGRVSGFREISGENRSNGIISMSCSVGGLVVNEHVFACKKTKPIQKTKRGEKRETEDEEYASSEMNCQAH